MPTRTVDLDDAKEHLAELIDEAQRGAEVVITRQDEPVAKLVPLRRQSRGGFGSARDRIWIADDFDAPLDAFADNTS